MDQKEDSFQLSVKALIQNDEGRLLLLQLDPKKMFKKKADYSGDYWDLPGGRIHKNESLEDALKREVYEETGLKNIKCLSSLAVGVSSMRIPVPYGDVGVIFMVYLCSLIDGSPSCLSDEHIHLDWFEPSKAAELLAVNHPAEIVEKIAQLQLKLDSFAT